MSIYHRACKNHTQGLSEGNKKLNKLSARSRSRWDVKSSPKHKLDVHRKLSDQFLSKPNRSQEGSKG
jgi:hypothetical protein